MEQAVEPEHLRIFYIGDPCFVRDVYSDTPPALPRDIIDLQS
jgi:hypothetical protein